MMKKLQLISLLKTCLILTATFFTTASQAQNVLYVNASAAGTNTGADWTNAYTSLKDAVTYANANTVVDSILVAAGTYYPTGVQSGINRDETFAFTRNGLSVLGGYSSTGNGTRDLGANTTILSGDIGAANNITDNSYHVMVLAGVPNSATDSLIIEGFTITGGRANGSISYAINSQNFSRSNGGGVCTRSVNSNSVIKNCIITNNNSSNYAGGVHNYSSAVQFVNCSITSNTATEVGGGFYNTNSSAVQFVNCNISGNTANYAGGIYITSSSSSVLTNCSINGNSALLFVGGIHIYTSSSAVLTNCSISGNTGTSSGNGLNIFSTGQATVSNSIILGNSSSGVENYGTFVYSNSLIQGLTSTANDNIDATGVTAAAVFENPVGPTSAPTTTGDYRLKIGSPAINVGNNTVVTTATDLAGNPRIQGGTVDLGAYEIPVKVYVNSIDGNDANSGTSWASAFKTLSYALTYAHTNTLIDSILVAAGTYYPTGVQSGTDRDATFAITRNGLSVLGGYNAATGTRDLTANTTILSGDIGVANTITDNSYHVMVLAGVPNSTTDSLIIEGFTISNAFANTPSNLTINGQVISRANGGGISARSVFANTAIRLCIIKGNSALYGGGIYNYSSSPGIYDCVISGNRGNVDCGGVYNFTSSSPVLTNCVISGNRAATTSGGAIYNSTSSSPVARNCIIFNNSSPVNNVTSSTFVYTYTLLQNATGTSNGNISSSGLTAANIFVNPIAPADAPTTAGDYSLIAGSPVIDAGNNAVVKTTTDLAGNARIQGGMVDIGAYESSVPSVLYVNASATGSNTGADWANAYTSFEDALAVANAYTNVDSLLIAGGTYKPTNQHGNTDPRDAVFLLTRNGLKILGGYNAANGTRNITANPTILSGDLGIQNDTADNAYHIMLYSLVNNMADSLVIQGFTFTGGNAHGTGQAIYAGSNTYRSDYAALAIYDSLSVVRNCIFKNNYGRDYGAVSFRGKLLSDCIFEGNKTSYNRAGALIVAAHLNQTMLINNCIFTGNSTGGNGGAVFAGDNVVSTDIIFNNCIFTGNSAGGSGGAVFRFGGTNTFNNCIIWGNTAPGFPAIFRTTSSNVVNNSIIQVSGYSGTGAVVADPLFVNAADPDGADNIWGTADDGLRVFANSPANNSGNNSLVPASLITDILGNARIQNTTVDMGAYEGAYIPPVLYVNASATGSNTGLDWTNAYTSFEDALAFAHANTSVDSILVAGGTYKPTNQHGGGVRDATFAFYRNGLKVLGGYSSTGNGSRDIAANPTILSGDIGILNDSLDNSHHVMVLANVPNSATDSLIIEGFTITDGNANVVGSISINGQTIYRQCGGGIYSTAISSNVSLRQLIINNNAASDYGGGMYNSAASFTLANSIISGNNCTVGSAVYNQGLAPTFVNCSIYSNYHIGGTYPMQSVMFNDLTVSMTPVIINCTITNNTGTVYNLGSEITVHNSIIFGNTWESVVDFSDFLLSYSVTHSLIENFTTSANNNIDYTTVTAADVFVNPANDFRLKAGSPAIDAGSNALVPSGIVTDVLGNDRIVGSVVDLGAYEYNAALPLRLLSFEGKRTNGINNLVWKTANESNLTNYEVQYSKNALEFSTVQMVKANNNSSNNYTVSHNPPEAGREAKFYYRIKINEADGKVSYSKIVTLTDNKQQSTISVYPNPARNNVTIKMTDNSLHNTNVVVLNAQGKIELKTIIKSTNQQLNVSTLSQGIYFLRFANGEIQKLIKE